MIIALGIFIAIMLNLYYLYIDYLEMATYCLISAILLTQVLLLARKPNEN